MLDYLKCPPLEEGYREWFVDAGHWRPYVEEILRRHRLGDPGALFIDKPGSHPVFCTESGYAVKVFAPLWPNDARSEMAVYNLVAEVEELPVPTVAARGSLFPNGGRWQWPYLVTTLMPGHAVGALRERITRDDLLILAQSLGPVIRSLHRLGENASKTEITPGGWESRVEELCCMAQTRRKADGSWSDEFVRAIPAYLSKALRIPHPGPPRLVHADITEDHVLMRLDGDRFRLSGLIDFADAVVGDPVYELVALHLDLFHCDTSLLNAFLRSYGPDPAFVGNWRTRATAFVLLFPFPIGSDVLGYLGSTPVNTPDALEQMLWP